jgi:hypothetical protein
MNQDVSGAKRGKKTPARRTAVKSADLRFERSNYLAMGLGLVAIVVGFILLAGGSITAAPILLVLGYCVLVPYGLASGRDAQPPGE